MIVITETEYELTMRILMDAPPSVEREKAIAVMKLAMIHGLTREIQYAHITPALLRKQAN